MTKNKKKAHLTGEHFTHRSVWHVGEYLAELGCKDDDNGWNATLGAMLFTYIALESYLNFVGEHVFPEIWKDERTFFSVDPYRGTLGKLDYVLGRCGCKVNKGQPPYQTVKLLDQRRHELVHPRPERIDRSVTYSDPNELHLEFQFHQLADEEFVALCRRDVEALADTIHRALRERSDDPLWGDSAFVGLMGHQGGWLE